MPATDKIHPVSNCAAIILAAGQSTRLGRPKQLLHYRGKTLLQHTIDAAKFSAVQSIIVVLGQGHDFIINEIDRTGLHIIINDNGQAGIASSISCGLKALENIAPDTDAAIFMVCDQPFVTSTLIDQLITTQKISSKPIIACSYENTTGIPALFSRNFFGQLLELKGDTGAKKIIQQNPDALATVPFPLGTIDIDTLGDYESLLK